MPLSITPEDIARVPASELPQLERDIDAYNILESPASFAQTISADSAERWLPYPHLRYTNDAIVDLIDESTPTARLLVTEPPRHGKSLLCSLYTPAWYLNRYPDRRVILASYGDDFAAEWGRKVRDLIDSHDQLLNIRISRNTSAADRWEVDGHLGGMKTVGVGGQVTGRGAHLLIIDDPVKDAEDANSLTIRDKKWDWWRSTIQTRLEPGAVVLLIQTRWHEDDLAGRILEHERERWKVVNLPAIAEESDPVGRQIGAALCPQRYDENALGLIRESIGAQAFSALYQQRPMPESGGMFRQFRYWRWSSDADQTYVLNTPDGPIRAPIKECWRFATCDLALTTRTSSDYTVVAVWDVAAWLQPSVLILNHLERVRITGAEHVPLLQSIWKSYHPSYIGIESNSFGSMTIQSARRAGIITRELRAHKDKQFRARDAALLAENSRLYLPERAPWLHTYEHEMRAFPAGTHDDCVDVTAYAARELLTGINLTHHPARPEPVTLAEKVYADLTNPPDKHHYHPILGQF